MEEISHLGQVDSVEGNCVRVRIVQTSACESCHAKAICASSEKKEKLIEAYVDAPESFSPGQTVEITGRASMGMKAVAWAYGIPLLLMMLVLFVCSCVFPGKEVLWIVLSLSGLALYALFLYFFRHHMAKEFAFIVKHINKNK